MQFTSFPPILQAFLATLYTWGMTAVGAASVFLKRKFSQNLLNAFLGFASGVMIAASFWSLLAPAIELTAELGMPQWLPAVIGFLAGGAFLYGLDKLLPHLHFGGRNASAEGIHTNWQRSVLLVLAITLHNIPEGLAVGVAFGAAAARVPQASIGSAIALAIGIGLQNLPEGLAVSVPLRREGLSSFKSFWWGQVSGLVEILAGLLGVAAALAMRSLLPFALSFAAGAMIYVVIEELIPEAQSNGISDISTIGAMIGFTVMMFLDVVFG